MFFTVGGARIHCRSHSGRRPYTLSGDREPCWKTGRTSVQGVCLHRPRLIMLQGALQAATGALAPGASGSLLVCHTFVEVEICATDAVVLPGPSLLASKTWMQGTFLVAGQVLPVSCPPGTCASHAALCAQPLLNFAVPGDAVGAHKRGGPCGLL